MTVKRMDNVGIVVEDIDAAIEFFTGLGLELEGRAPIPIEGEWADGVTGLRNMRVEIAMMRTPDGLSRLELSRFLTPRSSSAKWSSTKTRIGSAISGAPKEFSSGSRKSSGSRLSNEHM
jgi:hypothetical protein